MTSVIATVMNFDPGKEARVLALMMALVLSLTVSLAGVLTPMSVSEAQEISEELEEIFQYRRDLQSIFGNNFVLCMITFTPVLGVPFAFFSLYSTGIGLAALAISSGFNPAASFILYFFLPFFWMEYVAVALAMSQSLWLTLRIAQRRSLKIEAINTCVLVTVCAVILLLAAVVEIATVQLLT